MDGLGAGLDAANSALESCASFSGIDVGDVVAVSSGAAVFGGLVSCTLGSDGDGDCTGRVMEVLGTEALRGVEGGCDGNVYAWKAATSDFGVVENWRWRTRLRRQERHTERHRLVSRVGAFILVVGWPSREKPGPWGSVWCPVQRWDFGES